MFPAAGHNNLRCIVIKEASVRRLFLFSNYFIYDFLRKKTHYRKQFSLESNLHTATFAPRSRAAVARWAHNPKVGSSNLPFATESHPFRRMASNFPKQLPFNRQGLITSSLLVIPVSGMVEACSFKHCK